MLLSLPQKLSNVMPILNIYTMLRALIRQHPYQGVLLLKVHISIKNIACLEAFLEAPDDETCSLGDPVVGAYGVLSDCEQFLCRRHSPTKDSIASQRYATPRDFAVNSVTLRKWRHLVKSVLNYDNEGSNYRDCTSMLGHDSKGSNDRGCTSGHINPPFNLNHPTGLVDSVVFKLV